MTEGMTPAPLSSTPAAGRRRHRACAGQRPAHGVDPVGAAAGVLRDAAAAAVRLAQDAAMIDHRGRHRRRRHGRASAKRRAPNCEAPQSFTDRKRQLDLLDDTVPAARRRVAVTDAARAAKRCSTSARDDVHVVASGDPLLHGIGGTLIRLFGRDKVRVLPHVSSVTLACARMGWTVHDTEVISLVTAAAAHRGAPRRPGDRAVASDRTTAERWPRCSTPTAAAIPSSPCSSNSAARTSAAATAPRATGPTTRPTTSTTST